jgi:hypothetical protein
MFKELLWASTLQTLNGLADGNREGRIADLFPEEFREENILAKRLVGTLLTVVSARLFVACITNKSHVTVLDLSYVTSLASAKDSWTKTVPYVSHHCGCPNRHV